MDLRREQRGGGRAGRDPKPQGRDADAGALGGRTGVSAVEMCGFHVYEGRCEDVSEKPPHPPKSERPRGRDVRAELTCRRKGPWLPRRRAGGPAAEVRWPQESMAFTGDMAPSAGGPGAPLLQALCTDTSWECSGQGRSPRPSLAWG